MKEIIRKNMNKKNQTAYRPEQLMLYDILRLYAKRIQILRLEYTPHAEDITPKDSATTSMSPVFDIFLLADMERYDIELDGPIHDEAKQIAKDELRDIYVENCKTEIRVIRVNHREFPQLWKGKWFEAIKEVRKCLQEHDINLAALPTKPKSQNI